MGFGNIVLVHYPTIADSLEYPDGITIQYSHLQNFWPDNPFYQSIDYANQYIPMPVSAGQRIGNVGYSGNAANDTSRMHVDLMIYKGRKDMNNIPGSNHRISTTLDPYPFLYHKSMPGRIAFIRILNEKIGGVWVSTEETLAVYALRNMTPFNDPPYTEGESGKINNYIKLFSTYNYTFEPNGEHYLIAQRIGAAGGYSGQLRYTVVWGCELGPFGKIHLCDRSNGDYVFHISPNPFNSTCRITGNAALLDPLRKDSFSIGPEALVYDLNGRQVSRIEIERKSNSYKIIWDGKDQNGSELPSGGYLIRFVVNDHLQTAKVTLLR